jgi:hypothetical protein
MPSTSLNSVQHAVEDGKIRCTTQMCEEIKAHTAYATGVKINEFFVSISLSTIAMQR